MRELPLVKLDTPKSSGASKYYDVYGNYIPQQNALTQSGNNGYFANTNNYSNDILDGGYETAGDYDFYNGGSDVNGGGKSSLDWTGKDMVGVGLGVGQLGLGILNYRANRDMQKTQMAGINENIAASKEQRKNRRTFIGSTNSAFGAR